MVIGTADGTGNTASESSSSLSGLVKARLAGRPLSLPSTISRSPLAAPLPPDITVQFTVLLIPLEV